MKPMSNESSLGLYFSEKLQILNSHVFEHVFPVLEQRSNLDLKNIYKLSFEQN